MRELMNTKQAAIYLGCAPSTLKISRVYGRLLGEPAPPHIKMGRAVRYSPERLDEWLAGITSEVVPEEKYRPAPVRRQPRVRDGHREEGS